jgi:hypothetical protein
MICFARFGSEHATYIFDLSILHLLHFHPGKALLDLVALVVQESRILGVGYFGLVDPKAIQSNGVGTKLVSIGETAHLEGASGDVDHQHAVPGSRQGITQLGRLIGEGYRRWR